MIWREKRRVLGKRSKRQNENISTKDDGRGVVSNRLK